MVTFKLVDIETQRVVEGEADFAVIVADGDPLVAGAAPATKLLAALLGLAEGMVANTGPARIPISPRWQTVHAAIAQLRVADQPAGARALSAFDVLDLVGTVLGPDAKRDIQEAIADRARTPR